MSAILWLASYPKSGSTWFRVFVANLLSEADKPVDINELGGGAIASARDRFDEIAGVEAADLTPDEIERLRPRVYELMAAEAEAIECRKIHDAYTSTSGGRPLVPAAATWGALYFLRNPLDVAVSYAHHADREIDTVIDWMADEDHSFCAGTGRLHSQLRQRLLTWSGHVLSWVDGPEFEVRAVRYEDMSVEPETAFASAADFAGLPVEPDRIRRALEFSRVEELQRQEAEHGFEEKNPETERFFRQGRVGSWRETLTAEQATRIIEDHAEVMQRFGYLDSTGEPVF